MKARDIMQGPVEDVMSIDTIYQAFGKMRRLGLHLLPVVDAKSQLVGIVSDRDILRALAEIANMDAPMPLVSECMRRDVITCSADEPVPEVIEKLLNYHINCLPVLDDEKRCIGMISSRDVIRCGLMDGSRSESSPVKYAEM
ncbi:MAG: HPP family protein [Oligoflexus sp.]